MVIGSRHGHRQQAWSQAACSTHGHRPQAACSSMVTGSRHACGHRQQAVHHMCKYKCRHVRCITVHTVHELHAIHQYMMYMQYMKYKQYTIHEVHANTCTVCTRVEQHPQCASRAAELLSEHSSGRPGWCTSLRAARLLGGAGARGWGGGTANVRVYDVADDSDENNNNNNKVKEY